MPLVKFTEESARLQRKTDAMSLSRLPKIQSITLDLLNNPKKRNPEIVRTHLEAGLAQSIKELGNKALAEAYWNQIADLMRFSFKDLAKVPKHQRGPLWYDAAGTMTAVAQEQAMIQADVARETLSDGIEFGAKQKQLIGGASREQIKEANFAINAEMKKQAEAEDGNGEG
jgi:hypothetical protein